MSKIRPTGKEKSWTDWVTLGSSLASLVVSSSIAILTYRIDAKTKAFESNGYLSSDYVGVDLFNFCGAEAPATNAPVRPQAVSGTEPSDISFDLNKGFIRNDVWREAVKRTTTYCDRITPVMNENGETIGRASTLPADHQNVAGYALVFMIIRSDQSLFSIAPVLDVESIDTRPGADIWKYVTFAGGKVSHVPLGPIRKGEAVLFPVAIIQGFKSDYRHVAVPKSVRWTSPVTEDVVKAPLDFIVDGEYWRSKQQGVTASGGPVL